MIELHVGEYCQDCSEFEPDVEKTDYSKYGWSEPFKHDTLITCKHKYRCNDLVAFLENKIKEEK